MQGLWLVDEVWRCSRQFRPEKRSSVAESSHDWLKRRDRQATSFWPVRKKRRKRKKSCLQKALRRVTTAYYPTMVASSDNALERPNCYFKPLKEYSVATTAHLLRISILTICADGDLKTSENPSSIPMTRQSWPLWGIYLAFN